jgi:hypothetical protein
VVDILGYRRMMGCVPAADAAADSACSGLMAASVLYSCSPLSANKPHAFSTAALLSLCVRTDRLLLSLTSNTTGGTRTSWLTSWATAATATTSLTTRA